MAKKRKKKRHSFKKVLFRIAGITFLLGAILLAAFISAVNAGWFGSLPDGKELQQIKNESATLVYSSDNQLLGKFFAENRTNIDYEQLPDHLINALIATEDARFFTHEGIDSKSYLRVFFKTILLGDRSSGGGSTITQQLAKNLFGRPDFGLLSMPVNKTKEALVAYRLEKLYTKKEILLLYFNTVPFGENVFGVEAAANRYFNSSTTNLTIAQSAVIVGILKANTYYNPRLHPDNALERRNLVLRLMHQQGYISDKQYETSRKAPLNLDYANFKSEGPANYFLQKVRKKAEQIVEELNKTKSAKYDIEKDGLKIYTTLDAQLQKAARKSAKEHLSDMQQRLDAELKGRKKSYVKAIRGDAKVKRELFGWEGPEVKSLTKSDSIWYYRKMLHAAVYAMEPSSGAVKVYVGGNHFRYLPYDLVDAKRAAASAFKPILYAAALSKNYKPCDYLSNKEKVYEEYQDWQPQNYDKSSGGFVAMWYALAHSMNLPTIDLYHKTGHLQLDYMYRKLGFSTPLPEKPAVALGSVDVSLKELVKAYSAFAADGIIAEPYIIEEIKDNSGNVIYQHPASASEKVLTTRVAELNTLILEKAARSGTGQALYTRFGLRSDWASKTGTSQNFSDARFMVYNPSLVTGVWVGAYDPAIHFRTGANGSGARLALPVAAKMLREIEQNRKLHQYQTSFSYDADTSGIMSCQGKIDSRSMKTILNAVIGDLKGEHKTDTIPGKEEKEKKESKVKKFFKKLFGGGKK